MSQEQLGWIQDYYGKTLQSKQDLKTNACCTAEAMPDYLRPLVANIEEEVQDRFYGCGAPIPHGLEGATVLDLGCGTGRDVFLAAQLIGSKGKVIGLDMTEEQLEIARKHQVAHEQKFGIQTGQIEFKQGYIEQLKQAGIEDETVDVIISNCVLNLSPDKPALFKEAFRALKPGGELYFSDVFCDRRLDQHLRNDPILVGECLGGAMYIQDFRRLLAEVGCKDYRIMQQSEITINDQESKEKVGEARFYSLTIRAFKLEFEDRCEDYDQLATYLGGLAHCQNQFILDHQHSFDLNQEQPVCGNTADMLSKSRFAPYFKIRGDKQQHFGIFDCSPKKAKTKTSCC